MEILYSLFAAFFAVFLSICAWKILNWVWFTPKKLEKCLRQQGFSGNSYRLFIGDMKEMSMIIKEAKSKPMNFSNDIAPRIIPSISKTIEKYGKNSFSWLGPKPAVLIMDPQLIREILSKSYIFKKPESPPLAKMVAQGLASYEKEKWAKHRRIINPAFHLEKLKHMIPVFSMSCHEMLSRWEKIVSTKESCELDVWPSLRTLTSDAIARTAFGSNYEEGRKIFELQREQAELIMQIEWLIYIPSWRFLASKRIKRILETAREVNSAIFDIVDRRMKAIKRGEAGNDDLLGLLLESNHKEIHQHGNRSVGMSIEEVIEECKLFHFAGQETTSVLLVWTMILLSKHSDWQKRAREEVLKIFGSKTPEYDELHCLKTLTKILYEVLRLYPPAVMLGRVTSNETKLGKMSLPAGVQLLIPMILLHHDKEIWGNDAKVFNPDRFREGIPKATKGQFAFFPFGWGPRICIGQNFAMLEVKIALAMILQRFTFELSPSYTHAPYTAITLQPQYGAQLVLRKV